MKTTGIHLQLAGRFPVQDATIATSLALSEMTMVFLSTIPFLNVPIISVVLLLVAGILIGHLIWYRDRGDDDAQLQGLRGENHDLQESLHQHKRAFVELETELDQHKSEWDRLRKSHHELAQTLHTRDAEQYEQKAEMTRLHQLKDQAFHDLDQERQQRRSLQEALKKSEERLTQLAAQLADVEQSWTQLQEEVKSSEATQLSKLQVQASTLDQLTLERETIERERETLRRDLERIRAESDTTCHQLRSDLGACERELRELRETRDELTLQLADEQETRKRIEGQVARVDQLVAQRDRALLQVQEFQSQLADMGDVTTQREQLAGTLQSVQAERDQLRQQLADVAVQLGRERHQREHLQVVMQESRAELEKLSREQEELARVRAELAELQRQVVLQTQSQNEEFQKQTGALVALQSDYASAKQLLADKTAELENIKRELNTQSEHLQATLAEQANQQQIKEQLLTLQGSYQTQVTELQGTRQRLADLIQAKEQLVEKASRLDKVLLQRDEILQTQATTEAALQQAQEELVTLRAQIHATPTSTPEDLEKQLTELTSARQEIGELQLRLNETAGRLRRVTEERDEHRRTAEASVKQVSRLETRIKSTEETVRHLRRERGTVLSRFRQTPPMPMPTISSAGQFTATQGIQAKVDDRLRRDELLGMVYVQPPQQKDDLKRISGIAQVLEKKLNAFGIYTFRQIMDWDETAVSEFSKLLSFRDRIRRDDWIGQARTLYHETYGKAA